MRGARSTNFEGGWNHCDLIPKQEGNHIKIEPRGKYPGVKLHLDKVECEALLKATTLSQAGKMNHAAFFFAEVVKKLVHLLDEVPHLLEDRTEAQITAELQLEMDKSKAKLEAISKGTDWKKVKL